MKQQTQGDPLEVIAVRRSDPVYNAHGYLTKVPVAAITPFLDRYTSPGDVVLDVFAGSGMTGVAAALRGRRAVLTDISRLGAHVGSNYLNFVSHSELEEAASLVLKFARDRANDPYATACASCDATGTLSRSIWSVVYRCPSCSDEVVFFNTVDPATPNAGAGKCPSCSARFTKRNAERLREQRVKDVIACECSRTLIEQEPADNNYCVPDLLSWPDLPIESHREMFRRSALAKHGLTSTATFFSKRNLAALAALRDAILEEPDAAIRDKLLFVFTAILPRASKRYQWGPTRPLNAQNQTYYVAAVFLEWNVFDLFARKLKAVEKSDQFILAEVDSLFANQTIDVRYEVASADDLHFLANESIDYVFTDPPFGSNIFYSDMTLFQEAWLGQLTDPTKEAVIATNGNREKNGRRYESLLTGALRECARVLKPSGRFSLVFSNSSGDVWAMAQRAIQQAGFEIEPDGVCLLDKGQRSVKGLTSGYERVVTTDLIMTMRKSTVQDCPRVEPGESIDESIARVLSDEGSGISPSYLYLRVIKRYLRRGWALDRLSYGHILETADDLGLRVDSRTGRFVVAS
ncbi:MAG: DNA methyltransferase [Actinomycetota bacterium]